MKQGAFILFFKDSYSTHRWKMVRILLFWLRVCHPLKGNVQGKTHKVSPRIWGLYALLPKLLADAFPVIVYRYHYYKT